MNLGKKLRKAVYEVKPKKVRRLLEQGADIEAFDKKGFTPLLWAAYTEHLEITELLLEWGADVDSWEFECGYTSLYYAAFAGNIELTKLLLQYGPQIQPCVLEVVARKGKVGMLEMLIKAGAEIDNARLPVKSPLLAASECGYHEIVKMLLEAGADINMHWAGWDVPVGNLALNTAAKRGFHEIVKLLVEAGVDVDVKNDKGQTAFDIAAAQLADLKLTLKALDGSGQSAAGL